MRKNNSGFADLAVFIISLILVSAVCFCPAAGKLSLAMAAAMYGSGGSALPDEAQTENNETSETLSPLKPQSKNSDITETPEDIIKLIEKYTELFANDKKDGTISSVTYKKTGATHIFGNVKVKNNTDTKTLDIEKTLSYPLELSIDKSKPAVLIFHSHTSEGYEMIERDWYACDYVARSNNENLNIVRVGTEIASRLEALGYKVIHDKTIHDDNYSDSYPNSRKTVRKHLEENPQIQIVLDIHRDAITQNDGTKIKPVSTINGKKAAQLMIITGAEEGKVTDFPDWEYNLRFALQLQKKCETMFSGLMRPVLFLERKYNMDMTRFSLLIEMGSEANTLEEACYSGRMLADALASLMDEYAKE